MILVGGVDSSDWLCQSQGEHDLCAHLRMRERERDKEREREILELTLVASRCFLEECPKPCKMLEWQWYSGEVGLPGP